MGPNETLRWILTRGVGLVIGTVVLLVIYRVGLSAIHRLVPTVINAQSAHLPVRSLRRRGRQTDRDDRRPPD